MTDRVHFDDLTKINVPFGLLDDDTQERLRAHGGPCQVFDGRKWVAPDTEYGSTLFYIECTYRVAPPKPRRLIVKDWAMIRGNFVARDEDGHIGSYEGKPIQEFTRGADGYWANAGAGYWTLDGYTEALIDPGTCDWREAIDCRDDPNSAKEV